MYLIIGLALGIAATWSIMLILAKSRASLKEEQEKNLEAQILEAKTSLRSKEDHLLQLTGEIAASRNENKNLLEKLQVQKEEIRILYDKMNVEFKNLANEISNKLSPIKKTDFPRINFKSFSKLCQIFCSRSSKP